jgi:Fe-S-cluster containining protein
MTPYEKLEALYAALPTVQCKKLCGREICGPIPLSRMELQRIEQKVGVVEFVTATSDFVASEGNVGLRTDFDHTCKFLERTFGRCLIYEVRPLICRLWGCVDDPRMRCVHGCQPSRWLTNDEAMQFYIQLDAIQKEWQAERRRCSEKPTI